MPHDMAQKPYRSRGRATELPASVGTVERYVQNWEDTLRYAGYEPGPLAASASTRRTLAMIAFQSRSRSAGGLSAGEVSTTE